ncbi:MAG: hypothetical protein KY445_09950 [Armatimonadetes bacterium]|nr:hypothetical protein [Armatimonadota bacterium]
MRPAPAARPPLFSPRQSNLVRRLAAFALRFWPLWGVWLLILAIPVSREVAGVHFLGSPLASLYDQPWRKSFGRGSEFNGFRAARKHPNDLNARLWRLSLMMKGLDEDFDQKPYKPQELLDEALAIERAFPKEKWLVALPVRVVVTKDWFDIAGRRPPGPPFSRGEEQALAGQAVAERRRWMPIVQKAARLEPNNAFYPFVEALLWRRMGNWAAMWGALDRASQCREFDPRNLEIASRIVTAHEAIRPLILEEKEEVWRQNNRSPFENDETGRVWDEWIPYFAQSTQVLRKQGNHRRIVEIGAIMGRLGDLMQRGKNTMGTARVGDKWKNAVWALPPRSKAQMRAMRRVSIFTRQSSEFARYAALHGRKDIAALVPKWAARQRELSNELRPAYMQSLRSVRRDAWWRAAWWRDAGALIVLHGVFVAAFWHLANLFLWRGAGAPSTSGARIFPALIWLIIAVALALWTWLQNESYDSAQRTMAQGMRIAAVVSVGGFAFFAAPFVLALWCAGATIARNRSRFVFSTRLQTELRLFPIESGLLRAGATILCALAIAATFALWAALGFVLWNGIRAFDLTGWLPDAANGASLSYPIQSEMLIAPLFYCLLLDAICFVLWFVKWRWFSGTESRALTHSGLRFWKESLGVYVVLVSLIYLGAALSSWPARAAAHRELELRLTRGELPAPTPK